jgi:ATP-binding cassette subfamily C (CFTR/MRP) protein 1
MGTPTIRAYGLQNQFSRTVKNSIDDMNSAYYLTFANQRWLSVRLDLVGILLVFTTGILVVTSRFSVNPSIAGLVLSYILTIVQMIQFTVRQLAEVENNMNSTERIHHYGTQLEEEAPLHLGDVRPTWPEHGEIVFQNVEMRYRDGLPLVLKDLSMHVRAGERIGVVGRTGAGKSSIMSALFRLQELSSGAIVIDGVDIGKIGLHDLRSKLAIIPQDPTLFKGTIRSNLDPFHEHSDLELWASLRQANLVGNEQEMGDEKGRIHLDSVVEEEGKSWLDGKLLKVDGLTI